jgi:hypothetical protein
MITFDKNYLGHDLDFHPDMEINNPSYLVCSKCRCVFLCNENKPGINRWWQSEESLYWTGDWDELISCKDAKIKQIKYIIV